MEPFRPAGRRRPGEAGWRGTIERSGLFGPIEARISRFTDDLDADRLVERLASVSFVASAPEPARLELEAGLRELAAACGGVVPFAYRTSGYVTFSVG